MKNYQKKLYIAMIVISIFSSKYLYAQSNDLAVAMGQTVLLKDLNAGAYTKGSYLVLPFLGNFSLTVSSPISVKSSIIKLPEGKYINTERIADELNKKNINFDFSMDIINFGINIKDKGTISFSTKFRESSETLFPGDAIAFISRNAFENLQGYNLNFKTDATTWGELALGYTHRITNDLSIGLRLKYLSGIGHIGSNSIGDISLKENSTYNISADINTQMSGYDIKTNNINIGINNGYAIDFGAEYKFDFGLTLGTSFADLGQIFWDNKATTLLKSNASAIHNFTGIDNINEYYNDEKDTFNKDELKDALENLSKKIFDTIDIDTIKNKKFNTTLPCKLNFYANYAIGEHKRHNVSINMIGKIRKNNNIRNSLSSTVAYCYSNKNDGFRTFLAYTYDTNFGQKLALGIVSTWKNVQCYISGEFSPQTVYEGLYNTRRIGINTGLVFFLNNKNNNAFRK